MSRRPGCDPAPADCACVLLRAAVLHFCGIILPSSARWRRTTSAPLRLPGPRPKHLHQLRLVRYLSTSGSCSGARWADSLRRHGCRAAKPGSCRQRLRNILSKAKYPSTGRQLRRFLGSGQTPALISSRHHRQQPCGKAASPPRRRLQNCTIPGTYCWRVCAWTRCT